MKLLNSFNIYLNQKMPSAIEVEEYFSKVQLFKDREKPNISMDFWHLYLNKFTLKYYHSVSGDKKRITMYFNNGWPPVCIWTSTHGFSEIISYQNEY